MLCVDAVCSSELNLTAQAAGSRCLNHCCPCPQCARKCERHLPAFLLMLNRANLQLMLISRQCNNFTACHASTTVGYMHALPTSTVHVQAPRGCHAGSVGRTTPRSGAWALKGRARCATHAVYASPRYASMAATLPKLSLSSADRAGFEVCMCSSYWMSPKNARSWKRYGVTSAGGHP